jgi:uncharacterized protein (TIGR02246 family)
MAMSEAAVQAEYSGAKLAIEAIARRHVQAWNSHDQAGFESLFTDDADFVNVLGQRAHGRAQIGADFGQIHRTFMRNTQITVEPPIVRALDERTAIAHIRWSMTGMERVPGWNVPDVRHGMLLYVAVERGGEWKISVVQNTEEISVPLPK